MIFPHKSTCHVQVILLKIALYMHVCDKVMNTAQYHISHQICTFLLPDIAPNYISRIVRKTGARFP